MTTKLPSKNPRIVESFEKDILLKSSIVQLQENIAKFSDPFAGLTALFLDLEPVDAKKIGIY